MLLALVYKGSAEFNHFSYPNNSLLTARNSYPKRSVLIVNWVAWWSFR